MARTGREDPDSAPLEVGPEDVLRALADPERLSILGALVRGPRTAGALSEELELPAPRVRRHLARLSAAGLVATDARRRAFRFVPATLRRLAAELGPPRDAGLALGAVHEEEEAVLRHYFRGGRLREVPAKHWKRRIILVRLALEFEVGVRYSERDVNRTLERFHPDHATLRRYLVDEGFLTRDGRHYWRSGGPVDV